jgi:hypothetical protein
VQNFNFFPFVFNDFREDTGGGAKRHAEVRENP